MTETGEYMGEAALLLSRSGVAFDSEDDKFLTLFLDIAHHLEMGRMVIVREKNPGVEMLAYDDR